MDFSLKIIFFKGKCRNGWTKYKHKCLKFFDEFRAYSDAEKICQSNVGTLISIHSAEENKFVMDLANREKTKRVGVWIGAKRNNSLDYFEWTNGKEFDYSNWAIGQPTNSTDPESHVAMHADDTWSAGGKDENGFWYLALYICETDSYDE
jgi:hypothetical protein